jgi:hypothetical protein
MASAAAVVVVAWETELHPELLEAPDMPSNHLSVVPPAPPAPSARLPAVAVSPLAKAMPPAVVTAPPLSAPAIRPPFEVLTMAGAVASVVGGSWAPGGRVSVVMGRKKRNLAVSVDAWGGDTRTTALAPGQVRWRRFGVAMGPTLRLTDQHWELICAGQIAAGTVDAEGVGFGSNQQATGVQPGAVAAITLTVGSGRIFAWTSARAIVWPVPPRARAVVTSGGMSTNVEKSLGTMEVDFSLGLGVRLP